LIPLREFLGLARYQSKTSELEKVVTEVVSEQSYRRTTRHLDIIGMIPVPKTTAHRWVVRSDCDRLEPGTTRVPELLVDGTGYKRRPDPTVGIDNQGEVRVALGIDGHGTVIPLGAWTDKSWTEIGAALTPRDVQAHGRRATVLISDGEPGIAEGVAQLASAEQRCQWHQVHDLDRILHRDEAPLAERRSRQKQLSGILGIELPAADFQKVAEADKQALEQKVNHAEEQLTELVDQLIKKGYQRAATYIQRAQDKLFTYVRLWLSCGLVAYRVTSILERLMREIGRRLKRIAFGWSERGAAQMTRIIIKRITSADEWTKYWSERLRIGGRVKLSYLGAVEL
jgi:hypothetical protein